MVKIFLLSVVLFVVIALNIINIPNITSKSLIQESETPYIIKSVEFCGNSNLNVELLRKLIKTKVGELFDYDLAHSDLARIVKQGTFDSYYSRVLVQDVENKKINVIFYLAERLFIEDIKYNGLKSITMEELLKRYSDQQILLGKDLVYDSEAVDSAEDEIENLLNEKGYEDPYIDVKQTVIKGSEPNRVIITFNIDETPKAKINEIEFEGNKKFSNKELLKSLKNYNISNSKNLDLSNSLDKEFIEDIYDIDVLKIDLGLLRYYKWWEKGYLQAKTRDLAIIDTLKGRKVIVSVDEGKQFRIGKVLLKGAENVPLAKKLLLLSALRVGNIAEMDKLNIVVKSLEAKFNNSHDNSKIRATLIAEIDTKFGYSNGLVNLTILVEENPKIYVVRRLEMMGNLRTRDSVLRREVWLNEGDVFDGGVLARSLIALQNLDLFDKVEVYKLDFDEENGYVDIVVKVKERGLNQCD